MKQYMCWSHQQTFVFAENEKEAQKKATDEFKNINMNYVDVYEMNTNEPVLSRDQNQTNLK